MIAAFIQVYNHMDNHKTCEFVDIDVCKVYKFVNLHDSNYDFD